MVEQIKFKNVNSYIPKDIVKKNMSFYILDKLYVNIHIMNGKSLNSLFVPHLYTRHNAPPREALDKKLSQSNFIFINEIFIIVRSMNFCNLIVQK